MRAALGLQVPFLVGVGTVYLAADIAHPGVLWSPLLQTAGAIVLLVTVAVFLVPWEGWGSWWLITVAFSDTLAVAFIRAELLHTLSGVAMLAIIALLWLGYGYQRHLVLIAVAAAALLIAVPLSYRPSAPDVSSVPREPIGLMSALQWADVLLPPALLVAVAVVMDLAATRLRDNRARLQITRDRARRALDNSLDLETVNKAVLDTIDTAVALYDATGRLLAANQAAFERGERAGSPLDKPPYGGDRVFDADRTTPLPPEAQIIPLALRGIETTRRLIWVGTPGDQAALMMSSRRVHRDDGTLVGTVVAAQDVTELAAAIEIRDEFLKVVSHELRTPVTNITGYVELIEDRVGDADPELNRFFDVVRRNIRRLMERIEELLSTTEISSSLRPEDVDLADVVRSAIEHRAEDAATRGIALEQAGDTTAVIHADRHWLWLAVSELILNAIKFSKPGTTITVTHCIHAERALLTVQNLGVTISLAEQARIFDRFYRAPYARANAIPGFGIGLALVNSVVRHHDGMINIESDEEGLTRFTIDLPTGVIR